LKKALQAAWFTRGISWSWLLLPLCAVYYGLFLLLRLEFALGIKRRFYARVPVVVVGNFIVGGAGKTPVVIALVQALMARGLKVGVVSRGYARLSDDAQLVGADSSVAAVGDEPLLIAQKTGAPVAVARVRSEACVLLQNLAGTLDIIVSDDGLQHTALSRDVEWAVFDERGAGNGLLLPAGPLREPRRKVDAVLSSTPLDVTRALPAGAYHLNYIIDSVITNHYAQHQQDNVPISNFKSTPCAAVAGIGNPEKFFAALTRAGINLVETVPLPDHFDYSSNPFSTIKAEIIFITEKDALKCVGMDPRLRVVPQTLALPSALVDALLEKVKLNGQKAA
jgi:tetraacyldisaccharide 4'-kinase